MVSSLRCVSGDDKADFIVNDRLPVITDRTRPTKGTSEKRAVGTHVSTIKRTHGAQTLPNAQFRGCRGLQPIMSSRFLRADIAISPVSSTRRSKGPAEAPILLSESLVLAILLRIQPAGFARIDDDASAVRAAERLEHKAGKELVLREFFRAASKCAGGQRPSRDIQRDLRHRPWRRTVRLILHCGTSHPQTSRHELRLPPALHPDRRKRSPPLT